MTLRIPFVLAATVAALCTGLATANADVDNPVPLTTHKSAHGAQLQIAGFSQDHGLIFDDESNGNVYAVDRDGSNLRLIIHAAEATAVAGGLIEYDDLSGSALVARYVDLDTGVSGTVPDSWEAVTVGGGARTQHESDGWHLMYDPEGGGLEQDFGLMGDLPTDPSLETSIIASDRGLLVTGYPPSADPPSTEFYPTPDAPSHYPLDTTGIGADDSLGCLHISTSIACEGDGFPPTELVGLDPSASSPPAFHSVTGNLGDTVFAAGTTNSYAWSTYDILDDFDTFCPCRVHFANGTVITGLASATIATDDNANAYVYYVKGANGHASGIYRSRYGHGSPQLIVRSPRAPLDAIVPALGVGRAVWSDDSTSPSRTWSRSIRLHTGAPALGSPKVVVRKHTDSYALSGTRTAYLDRHGVHVRSGSHVVTIANARYLFGFSGFRVLYLGPGHRGGHLWIYNINSHHRWDATSHLHLAVAYTTPLLDGNYLTYFRPNGSVWRKDLASSHAAVQLGSPISHFAIGTVFGSGNYVAWTAYHTTGSDSVDRFRNVHPGAVTHSVSSPWMVAGASAAGVAVSREDASGDHYELRSWTDGSTITTLPPGGGDSVSGANPPSLNGQLVGYLGDRGRPTVAVLPEHVVNRPYALGSPAAPKTVRRNATWHFDLPTSAPLSACEVLIYKGANRIRDFRCDTSAMPHGEARASWHAIQAPHRYKWKLLARNSDGSLLRADRTSGALKGHVHIH